jgi:hypothetical protein
MARTGWYVPKIAIEARKRDLESEHARRLVVYVIEQEESIVPVRDSAQ